jgi:hypothetical protein
MPQLVVNEIPATSRKARSLINSASNSLAQAEVAWVRFVQSVEKLGVMRGDVEIGPKARNLAEQMHEFREVLTAWTQE